MTHKEYSRLLSLQLETGKSCFTFQRKLRKNLSKTLTCSADDAVLICHSARIPSNLGCPNHWLSRAQVVNRKRAKKVIEKAQLL